MWMSLGWSGAGARGPATAGCAGNDLPYKQHMGLCSVHPQLQQSSMWLLINQREHNTAESLRSVRTPLMVPASEIILCQGAMGDEMWRGPEHVRCVGQIQAPGLCQNHQPLKTDDPWPQRCLSIETSNRPMFLSCSLMRYSIKHIGNLYTFSHISGFSQFWFLVVWI